MTGQWHWPMANRERTKKREGSGLSSIGSGHQSGHFGRWCGLHGHQSGHFSRWCGHRERAVAALAVGRSLARLLARSLACSLARSLARSLAKLHKKTDQFH